MDDLAVLRAVAAVLGSAFGAYGVGQMVRGWRANRRGGDQKRLVSAGAANLLAGAAVWVLIFMYSEASHRFGEATGMVAAVVYLTLMMLSLLIRHRRRKS